MKYNVSYETDLQTLYDEVVALEKTVQELRAVLTDEARNENHVDSGFEATAKKAREVRRRGVLVQDAASQLAGWH